MAPTTKCPGCGVVLNLPDEARGRRLRCPKCQTKFAPDAPGTDPSGSSSAIGEAQLSSITTVPVTRHHDDIDLPTAAGDLRDTFDLPLMMDEDVPQRPAGRRGDHDAAALFKDDFTPRRKVVGGDARKQARRCSCGGVVPPGMSLCTRCGTDLDTGRREDIDEILGEMPVPIQAAGTPLGVLFVGALGFMASLLLAAICFVGYVRDSSTGLGLLGLVCLFGIYASVQFLRGKSAKPLLVALMIGAFVDVIVLIALPAMQANAPDVKVPPEVWSPPAAEDFDEEAIPPIPPYSARLEAVHGTQKITWGIISLGIVAGCFVYLTTSGVRKHFERYHLVPGMQTSF